MDQFISANGKKDHALMLDCKDLSYQYIPMVDPQVSVLVIDSAVKHSLADGGYAAEIELLNGTAREVKLDAIAFELKIGGITLRPRLAVSPLPAGAAQIYTLVVPGQALGGVASDAETSLDWWYYVLN